jgi:hypothetical protein
MPAYLQTRQWENDQVDRHAQVVKALEREIEARRFESDDSLEMSLDSIMLDVAYRLGAYVETTDKYDKRNCVAGYVFDFTGMTIV